MEKKKILLCSDVKGWGGWTRAEYIKMHLSDEFHFDIMDGEEFSKYMILRDKSLFTREDLDKYPGNFEKDVFEFEDFRKFCMKNKIERKYDLIYLLFHTQLLRKDVVRSLEKKNNKFITIVTSYPTVRASFVDRHLGMKESIKRFVNLADKCEAILANNKKSLKDLRSIYSGPSFYASRGVDEKIFYPTKEFKEKKWEDFTVAYVGKPVKEKGLEDIIRPACREANVRLIINTKNYTNALSPNQMNKFYNMADAYIVASTIDGTPNTALEAAACGLTLISNDIGNMPELIVNHKNGFLVDREIERYTHRLNWMKKNQRVSWEIGQKGREEILKNWTWNSVLNKNERTIFREVLK